jgi:hypothetical protein
MYFPLGFSVIYATFCNSQDILEDLLKEERKAKAKPAKKAASSAVSYIETHEHAVVGPEPSPVLLPKKDFKKEQEERELLDASLMADDDDFTMECLQNAEKENIKKETPVVVTPSPSVPKALTSRPMNVESTIFNELQDIDFNAEIRAEEEGKIDWNQVSCSQVISSQFRSITYSIRNR